eukprot:GGOE01020582.1.p1 GENE.GGOE01020582.1~~GGOE01020582.1.p1  ORF type:complete len:192 (-),score=0.25 GGOE01020582.1:13-588(-)
MPLLVPPPSLVLLSCCATPRSVDLQLARQAPWLLATSQQTSAAHSQESEPIPVQPYRRAQSVVFCHPLSQKPATEELLPEAQNAPSEARNWSRTRPLSGSLSQSFPTLLQATVRSLRVAETRARSASSIHHQDWFCIPICLAHDHMCPTIFSSVSFPHLFGLRCGPCHPSSFPQMGDALAGPSLLMCMHGV